MSRCLSRAGESITHSAAEASNHRPRSSIEPSVLYGRWYYHVLKKMQVGPSPTPDRRQSIGVHGVRTPPVFGHVVSTNISISPDFSVS